MRNYTVSILILIQSVVFIQCTRHANKAAKLDGKVYEDTVFTNKFLPKGNGFTGGDGTYSIEIADGRSIWIFGDSFIGNVTPDNKRIKTTPSYIRNSFVEFQGDSLITYQQGRVHEFKSMMIPLEVIAGKFSETELWYWPGDAFVENGKLNVFASKFYQKDHADMWGFEFRGTELVEFSLPDLKFIRVDKFSDTDSVHYGHAVLESGEYTYIYGLKRKMPYVARSLAGNMRGKWEFFNGKKWITDPDQAAPMLKFEGSEQFSVFRSGQTYVMIMQAGDLSRKIFSFISDTPYGPWRNEKMIYETPVLDNCASCWTYNALAHPQFTEDGLLLISYNTNSMNMEDHYTNALIYRPRFIRVPLKNILFK